MKNGVEISVITPIYKGTQYIEGLLSMVQKNSELFEDNKIELVLVNDYPTEPINISDKFNFKVTVVENPRNLGIQAARINGLKNSTGNYVMFLDQDDRISDTALFSQYSKIGDASAIISNGFYEDDFGKEIRLFKNSKQQNLVNDFNYYFYFGNLIASPGLVLVKKSSIPTAWMNNIMKINGADDWLLWAQFLKNGEKFVINDEFLYIHVNSGNNTSDNNEQMLLSSEEALKIYIDLNGSSKLSKVYKRRLKMRSAYENGEFSVRKLYQYLLNIDILWYILKFKLS